MEGEEGFASWPVWLGDEAGSRCKPQATCNGGTHGMHLVCRDGRNASCSLPVSTVSITTPHLGRQRVPS